MKILGGPFRSCCAKARQTALCVVGLSTVLLGAFAHADPVEVLGVSLGGQMPKVIKLCPRDFPPATAVCWVDRPFVGKEGSKFGSVKLPDDKLPSWAAYQSFQVQISKTGELQVIEVRGIEREMETTIRTSTSQRFGTPKTLSRVSNGSFTEWSKPDIAIELICPNFSTCSMRFLSSAERDRRDAAQAEQAKKEMARPATP